MLDIGSSELLLIVIVTIVVIGPKELPRVLYKVGQFLGKVRGVTRHFRSGIDAMVREVELEEMQKKWLADNARIMKEHPEVYGTADLVGADVETAEASAEVAPAAGEEQPVLPLEVDPAGTAEDGQARPEAAA